MYIKKPIWNRDKCQKLIAFSEISLEKFTMVKGNKEYYFGIMSNVGKILIWELRESNVKHQVFSFSCKLISKIFQFLHDGGRQ